MEYGSYKPLNIIIRIAVSSLLGYLSVRFCLYLVAINGIVSNSRIGIVEIVLFNLITEGVIFIDFLFEKRFSPCHRSVRARVLQEGVAALLWASLIYSLFCLLQDASIGSLDRYLGRLTLAVFVLVWSFLFVLMLLGRVIGKWSQSIKDIDQLKQEKMERDYRVLQDQLNPHFLFNNLSVLKSLMVLRKQEEAVRFIQNFSDVYRYVLAYRDKVTVRLEEELAFIQKYINLYKERLGNGLRVEITVDQACYGCEIAPLSLQLLVENAIKHNMADAEQPLVVVIRAKEGWVEVANNIRIKQTTYSTKVGLSNLIKRYEILSNKAVSVLEGDGRFVVRMPLL